jgi:hypothetical protein
MWCLTATLEQLTGPLIILWVLSANDKRLPALQERVTLCWFSVSWPFLTATCQTRAWHMQRSVTVLSGSLEIEWQCCHWCRNHTKAPRLRHIYVQALGGHKDCRTFPSTAFKEPSPTTNPLECGVSTRVSLASEFGARPPSHILGCLLINSIHTLFLPSRNFLNFPATTAFQHRH